MANRCFMCGEGEEIVDHLLIHCPSVRGLWELLLAIVGFSWVFLLSVKETLLSWRGSFVGKKRKRAWMVAPLSIFWIVWRERNNLVFNNVDLFIIRMKRDFLCSFWS